MSEPTFAKIFPEMEFSPWSSVYIHVHMHECSKNSNCPHFPDSLIPQMSHPCYKTDTKNFIKRCTLRFCVKCGSKKGNHTDRKTNFKRSFLFETYDTIQSDFY